MQLPDIQESVATNKAPVYFEELEGEGGDLGVINLNRPQVLNSLNHDMVLAIHEHLDLWAAKKSIKAVIIRAVSGRAFCAGGDLKTTFEKYKADDESLQHFFRDEYSLNARIFHYPKPYIAFLDGITMGGGVGISIHGSHRVGTENLLFAMPETGIGFFPDVGGTYFLPRIANHIGYYLGLTGERIKVNDAYALKIVTQNIKSSALPTVLQALLNKSFDAKNPKESVTAILNEFNESEVKSDLITHQAFFDGAFKKRTVEEIIEFLQVDQNEYSQKILDAFQKKSPTSLKVTLKALQQGAKLDFDECMKQEYRLVCHFLKNHDFMEGIRALLINKDQQPKWDPDTLAKVTTTMVSRYFEPMDESSV